MTLKNLYIAITVSVIVLVCILLALFYFRSTHTSQPSSISISPTSVPYITPTTPSFRLEKVNPPNDIKKEYFPITRITFTFNQAVNVEDIRYVITPATEVLILRGATDKEIVITPRRDWKQGTTEIIIQPATHSVSGLELNKSIEYTIRTTYPSTINPDTVL